VVVSHKQFVGLPSGLAYCYWVESDSRGKVQLRVVASFDRLNYHCNRVQTCCSKSGFKTRLELAAQ